MSTTAHGFVRPASPTNASGLTTLKCAVRGCNSILLQREPDWDGRPVWVMCRKCGLMNRVDRAGARVVPEAGAA